MTNLINFLIIFAVGYLLGYGANFTFKAIRNYIRIQEQKGGFTPSKDDEEKD